MCQGDTTMSIPVGKDADSNNGDQTSAAIAAEARRKSFKRALKGTVGTGLVAVSAALIARSDDIGEWLQSVAPNVLPHNEAGMDIVLRAIAEAKGCWEKGANVCLDAEGRVTALYAFLAQWYLSPRQHVVELAYSILILSPLVYLYWKLCRSRVSLQRATASFDFKRPNLLMKLWGASLLALMLAGAFLKFYKWELISHPAYLWQPCHVHSLVMGLCAFVPTERSLLVLHVATTLWWGPFLAFVAPSLPTDPVEIALFWAQHALMLLAPLVRLMVGTRWMYRDFWWNSVGFVFLSCYHFWLLAPINIFTGVNVATMTVPPASLEMFGKYYRPMWSVVCGLLQLAAVGVMGALAGLFGQWPPSSLSQTCGEGKSTTSGSASTVLASEAMTAPASSSGGKVSDDAVPVSPEKAVSLGDAE